MNQSTLVIGGEITEKVYRNGCEAIEVGYLSSPERTMRKKRNVQSSIFELYAEHEIGKELKGFSDWLDENLEISFRP